MDLLSWTSRSPGAQTTPQRHAVIDLGTNNCRMLIADSLVSAYRGPSRLPHSAQRFHIVDSFSKVVRLGEGLARSNQLSEAAMQRTLAALTTCAARIRAQGVSQVRAVATEACRRASNGAQFVAEVQRVTGLTLDIISSEEEARLGLDACAPLLSSRFQHALVYDIGGGSTEVSFLQVPARGSYRLISTASLPYGVVTLAEDPNAHYEDIVRSVGARIRKLAFFAQVGAALSAGQVQFVGMSTTVTTLAALSKGLKRYNRNLIDGSRLKVSEMQQQIYRLRDIALRKDPMPSTIGRGRTDLVLPGCAVLEGIVSAWSFRATDVADRGLREGLLATLLAETQPKAVQVGAA